MAIDRSRVLSRHNPILTNFQPQSPLSVGNGELAFTVDPTGLQTYPDTYDGAMPLCTQSQWGWHSFPDPGNLAGDRRDLRGKTCRFHGRTLDYYTDSEGQEEAYLRLRQNPHRLNLARIGFDFPGGALPADIRQELDLLSGTIESRFTLGGVPVKTRLCCDPERDTLAFAASSPLFRDTGRIVISFPYADPGMGASDWKRADKHFTHLLRRGEGYADFVRILDDTRYFVRVSASGRLLTHDLASHRIVLAGSDGSPDISFSCSFSPSLFRESVPEVPHLFERSRKHWNGFWNEGGFIDLGDCTDPRAEELERRIVLSQYLSAIQTSGSLPPQETGLTCNSWFGKFHLEMHYWNSAHFPLWNRPRLLGNSLWWYLGSQNRAEELARSQGFAGARWPKMVGPEGYDCPSPVGPLLIWQQPHPIMMAELMYRSDPSLEFLETFAGMVFATADFLADFPDYDGQRDRYDLGPGLIPAQENHRAEDVRNPAFELEYWRFGLETASRWRERLGLAPVAKWEEVRRKLPPSATIGGFYPAHENCMETFTQFNYDHPSMLAALGVLPGRGLDGKAMGNTLDRIRSCWNIDRMWGWDFPVMAMTAARLGRPGEAVDLLLMDAPKNTYLPNGHNKQTGREDLPLYLPGNGGLLIATALMAAGWDGWGSANSPGFPVNGKWNILWEGINPLP